MMNLRFDKRVDEPLTVLCLGAHSDDIEIGCGGTILRLKQMYSQIRFYWVVFSANGVRGEEACRSAELFTEGCQRKIVLKTFRDGYLPYDGALVKDSFEELKKEVAPDLIFTHWSGDAHQDHRLINELTWNTFRNHTILEYEIPKYDGDLGRPNVFVPLDDAVYDHKLTSILSIFDSQLTKSWFDRETFSGMLRLRGMESCAPAKYAEAFYARKLTL